MKAFPAIANGNEPYVGGAELETRLFNGMVMTDVRIQQNDKEYQAVLSPQQKNQTFQT
jgi:hypothetical protein